jgi:hypothetical protein
MRMADVHTIEVGERTTRNPSVPNIRKMFSLETVGLSASPND